MSLPLALALAATLQAQPTGWGVQESSGRPVQPMIWAPPPSPSPDPRYAYGYNFSQVIQQVIQMPSDYTLQSRVGQHGLNVVNVTWEDTARYGGSAVGPNISDLTLQVREPLPSGGFRTHLLPVIRHPNFTDKTGDVPAHKLWVRVGNHRGGPLGTMRLLDVVKNLRGVMSNPNDLLGSDDFSAPRDSHMLVSAQHVFLPIPEAGKVEFTPVIYNYQSSPGSPAVLTLLVTREGTSVRVIENLPGEQSQQAWGQELFFNKNGQRTPFTAERKSAVKARIERQGEIEEGDKGALEEGADMMMIVQIPLEVAQRHRGYGGGIGGLFDDSASAPASAGAPPPMAPSKSASAESRRYAAPSDVEQAVLGHGREQGAFVEIGGKAVRRDARFPIRVTVQFYKATSNGVVSDANLAEVASSIQKVYSSADYVGSLVVPEGQRHRPTDWMRQVFRGLFSSR